jgi:hypothetical protein
MILLADGTPDALLRMLNQRYFDVQKVTRTRFHTLWRGGTLKD